MARQKDTSSSDEVFFFLYKQQIPRRERLALPDGGFVVSRGARSSGGHLALIVALDASDDQVGHADLRVADLHVHVVVLDVVEVTFDRPRLDHVALAVVEDDASRVHACRTTTDRV